LSAGADINHRRRDGGSTALRLAADRGHIGTVQLLLNAGAKTEDEL
jgi:ankyrin repeat protein